MALAFDVKELRCKTCDAVLDMQTAHGGVEIGRASCRERV